MYIVAIQCVCAACICVLLLVWPKYIFINVCVPSPCTLHRSNTQIGRARHTGCPTIRSIRGAARYVYAHHQAYYYTTRHAAKMMRCDGYRDVHFCRKTHTTARRRARAMCAIWCGIGEWRWMRRAMLLACGGQLNVYVSAAYSFGWPRNKCIFNSSELMVFVDKVF